MSPRLFNIFINDIGDAVSEQDAPLLLDHRIAHLLYADDLLSISTTPKGLQYNIDKVNEFCNNWGLSVNVDKSKVMIFSKSGRVPNTTICSKLVKMF